MKNLKTFTELNESAPKSYLMTKTYQVSDQESAEAGDYKDQGVEYEDRKFDSLWEIAKEIRYAGATEPSETGTNVKTTRTTYWSTPDGQEDFKTGERTYYSFHPKLNSDAEAQELAALIKMDKQAFSKADPDIDESFNWDEYDNTDLAGSSWEMRCRELIAEFCYNLETELPVGTAATADRKDALKALDTLFSQCLTEAKGHADVKFCGTEQSGDAPWIPGKK